jgi:alpha-tubulin suppressor-like RCC1 family protein
MRHVCAFFIAVVVALAGCSENAMVPSQTAGPPASMQIVSGDQQSDTVGRQLPQPLVVRVLDSAGLRVAGQIVNFRVTAAGGSVFAGAAITNDSGEARERWTLGTVAGDTQRVEARAVDTQTGLALVFGVFSAVGVPDAPTTATKVGGDGQSGASGAALADSLSVKVTDQFGNAVSGTTVTWSVSSGGGSVNPATVASNAAGVAKTKWTLGSVIGVQNVTAGIGGHAPVTFAATSAAPSTPTFVTIVSGNNQTGVVGTVLPESLAVRVTDQNGINVAGVTVTWTVTGGGGSISPATSTTASSGLAKTQWTLGSSNTQQTVLASVPGIAGPTFQAHAAIPLTLATISAGGNTQAAHTCGLTASGAAYCWGANPFGELGNGTFASALPVLVSGGLSFATIDAGGYHTCAQTTGGAIYCWGYDVYGQLGDSSQASESSPVPFRFALALTSVNVGGWTDCGPTAAGNAYCWGWGGRGERGDGTTTETGLTPVQVLGSLTFSMIRIGAYHTCGLITGGTAYCWGLNESGQLGNGTVTNSATPVAVAGGLTFAMIAPGGIYLVNAEHTCGLTSAGAAYCWGTDGYGQLGDGGSVNQEAPVLVKGGLTFSTITAGGYHTCGLTTGGVAYCWGRNDSGQLGTGTTANAAVPAPVVGGLTFVVIDAGAYHTCGVTASGAAYCWGDNGYGELGDGTTTNRPTPTRVVSQ